MGSLWEASIKEVSCTLRRYDGGEETASAQLSDCKFDIFEQQRADLCASVLYSRE
jgi:hypothetical protein